MNAPRTKLLILGAGTLAAEAFDAADLTGLFQPVGFLVSDPGFLTQREHCGLPVFDLTRVPFDPADVETLSAIASPRRDAFVELMRERGFTFATVLHPRATISRHATIGPGCFVGAGAIVAARVTLREHVVVNRGANIGPDTDIGPCTTIGPGAVLDGAASIGSGAYIGVGAVIRAHITIGHGAVVAAGAVVVKPVPGRTLVTGSPARSVR